MKLANSKNLIYENSYPIQMLQTLIETLSNKILSCKGETLLRVGIDGIDAAGKTYLANKIAENLTRRELPIIRAYIDGFHNPREIRHRRGKYSPEGYYYDSFNYDQLKKYLLEPLAPPGNKLCRLRAFDFKTDTKIFSDLVKTSNAHILIFEGVFLFRKEIENYWDFKIFVDIDFQTSIKRALFRDRYLFGSEEEILRHYQKRYIPGQKLYLAKEKPREKADIVIDNNDFKKPFIKSE